MVMVAPKESKSSKPARAFLERVKAQDNPVKEIHYLDVRQSMQNGGGPACLRQRIWLSDEEKDAIFANVFFTPATQDSRAMGPAPLSRSAIATRPGRSEACQ